MLKGLLQSDRPKQHMDTIVIDQFLSNCAMYEHRCVENIKKIYTSAVKCNYQLQFKAILEASIVSACERLIDNSPMSPGPPMIVKKFSVRKSLRIFTEILDAKKKTAFCQLCAAKSKRKEILSGSMFSQNGLRVRSDTLVSFVVGSSVQTCTFKSLRNFWRGWGV